MDRMDEILSKKKYLAGDRLTEADIRAYTTSARFDVAYHGAFKCNLRLLRSYPNLNRWLKSIYWSEEYPDFKATTEFDAVRSLLILLTVVQKRLLQGTLRRRSADFSSTIPMVLFHLGQCHRLNLFSFE